MGKIINIKTCGSALNGWLTLIEKMYQEYPNLVFNHLCMETIREELVAFQHSDEYKIEPIMVCNEHGQKPLTVWDFGDSFQSVGFKKYRHPNIEVAMRYFLDQLQPGKSVLMPVRITTAVYSGEKFLYLATLEKGCNVKTISRFDVTLLHPNEVIGQKSCYLLERFTPYKLIPTVSTTRKKA